MDFQREVRPEQLSKLDVQRKQIDQHGQQLQANNDRNLAQIDASYKDTAELESQFISKKDENMNLINESEMEGIKFLQNFGTTTGETDSLNNQLNSIEYIIAILKREVVKAELEERQMEEVSSAEEKLIY